MNGLEAVELKLSKININNEGFRFDSDYFNKLAIKLQLLIAQKPHINIGKCFDVSKLAGFEYTEYFTNDNLNSNNNYIALTSKNVQNGYLELSDYITINQITADKKLVRSKLYKHDIVLSYTGEYRRSVVLEYGNLQLGPNVCRLRNTNNQINSYYLSTFLNSILGQTLLDKEKTLSAQPTVAMSRIRLINIPILTIQFQQQIEILIKIAHQKLEQSKQEYQQAEQILLDELGLDDFKPSNENISIRKLSNSFGTSGRLDSEYYQPRYDDYHNLITHYHNGSNKLFEICEIKNENIVLNDDIEYKYIELSNVNNYGNIINCTINIGKLLPSRARRMVNTGDVIISSIEGSMQSCAIVSDEYNNAICSTGFYIITSKKINSETLLVMFKSQFIQNLLIQNCSGTILTAINKNDFLGIKLPIIVNNIQIDIQNNVKKCFNLKRQSGQLLELAKHAVEVAIEQDEQTAMQLIAEKMNA